MHSERQRIRFWVFWHVVGFAVLLTLPSYGWFGDPVWAITVDQRRQILGHAGSYLIAVLLLTTFLARHRRVTPAISIGTGAAVLAGQYLVLLLRPDFPFSTGVLWTSSALTVVLLLVPAFAGPLGDRSFRALATAGLFALLTGTVVTAWRSEPPAPPDLSSRLVVTNDRVLSARVYTPETPYTVLDGGGISRMSDGFLIVTGGGHFQSARWDEVGSSLEFEPLALRAPPLASEGSQGPPGVGIEGLRINDIAVLESSGRTVILVTHPFWDDENRCMTLRLSQIGAEALDSAPVSGARWRTLHESRPCMQLTARDSLFTFAGQLTGGRVAQLDDRRLLLTVGNFSAPDLAQDTLSDYGKTVVIDIDSGTATSFTLGHRNAQGLLVTPEGRVWLTEHGPRGGDELNLLEQGANYGWPLTMTGVEYLAAVSPELPELGPEAGLRASTHAWVPSIGVSNLLKIHGTAFPHWRGDLLIGSLRAQSLFRMRLRGERVVFVEPIEIGARIRDLVEDDSGRILIWTDARQVLVLEPPPNEGPSLIEPCLECHTIGGGNAIGPDLQGVYGREIGSVEGYSYSPALRNWRERWRAGLLMQYLEDPAATAPGTTMEFAGPADSASRARLIEFLREFN